MDIIKKIGFFLADPRQIDYYKNILKNLSNNLRLIIINDFEYPEDSREYKKIEKFCVENKYEFTSSKILVKNNQKVLIVIGTGNKSYHIKKLPFFKIVINFIKFIFAKTFGLFIQKTKLNFFFLKIIKKNLTFGGRDAEFIFTEEVPPEAVLGHKKILFPRGMDIYYNHPGPMRKKYFDYFFSISKFDDEYVQKNTNKKSYIIGYPRYDQLSKNSLDEDLLVQLDETKKNILWITSDLIETQNKDKNIILWVEFVKQLTKNYNVIFRPHPNTVKFNKNLIEKIKETNLIVDLTEDRDLKILYDNSHLVIADYGGPIFSALYCKKNVLLFNVQSNLKKSFKFDLKMRDHLYNIDIEKVSKNQLNNILDNIESFNEIKTKSTVSRKKIFPNNDLKLEFNKIVNNIFENENKY
jgi:hypothetical protein